MILADRDQRRRARAERRRAQRARLIHPVDLDRPLRLCPSRLPQLLILFAATAYVLALVRDPQALEALGWGGVAGLLAGLLLMAAAIAACIPAWNCLELSAQGFHIRRPWRDRFVRWRDTHPFTKSRCSRGAVVYFGPEIQTLSVPPRYRHLCIHRHYDRGLVLLCERMNAWRAAALAREGL